MTGDGSLMTLTTMEGAAPPPMRSTLSSGGDRMAGITMHHHGVATGDMEVVMTEGSDTIMSGDHGSQR